MPPLPPNIQTTVSCYLCGTEQEPREMAMMTSPALSHRCDFALATTTWLCSDPCFGTARNTPRIRERIYNMHDAKCREYCANLQDALTHELGTRPDAAHLPEGLRVTEDEIERLACCNGDYCAEKMQDEAIIQAAFKLLRNHKRLPYYHSKNGVGELWDYSELCTRLESLTRSNT